MLFSKCAHIDDVNADHYLIATVCNHSLVFYLVFIFVQICSKTNLNMERFSQRLL